VLGVSVDFYRWERSRIAGDKMKRSRDEIEGDSSATGSASNVSEPAVKTSSGNSSTTKTTQGQNSTTTTTESSKTTTTEPTAAPPRIGSSDWNELKINNGMGDYSTTKIMDKRTDACIGQLRLATELPLEYKQKYLQELIQKYGGSFISMCQANMGDKSFLDLKFYIDHFNINNQQWNSKSEFMNQLGNMSSGSQVTALIIAAIVENEHLVEYLLQHGASVSTTTKEGTNVFHYACYFTKRSTKTIKMLLAQPQPNGASIRGVLNTMDNHGETPLDRANIQLREELQQGKQGHYQMELIELLESAGADSYGGDDDEGFGGFGGFGGFDGGDFGGGRKKQQDSEGEGEEEAEAEEEGEEEDDEESLSSENSSEDFSEEEEEIMTNIYVPPTFFHCKNALMAVAASSTPVDMYNFCLTSSVWHVAPTFDKDEEEKEKKSEKKEQGEPVLATRIMGHSLRCGLESVLNRKGLPLEMLFEGLNTGDMVIAGSCILQAIFGLNWESDVDCYIKKGCYEKTGVIAQARKNIANCGYEFEGAISASHFAAFMEVKRFYRKESGRQEKKLATIFDGVDFDNLDGGRDYWPGVQSLGLGFTRAVFDSVSDVQYAPVRRKNSLDLVVGRQSILAGVASNYASPFEMIEKFDIEMCKSSFDGRTFRIVDPRLTFHKHSHCIAVEMMSPNRIARKAKYEARGFQLHPDGIRPGVDKARMRLQYEWASID